MTESELLSNSTPEPNTGCWLWLGQVTGGYARAGGKQVNRVTLGLTDHGTQACHRCDNPPCVNPAHLFAASARANALDSIGKGRHANAAKTHCRKGHQFTDANTYRDALGYRHCRACNLAAKRRASEFLVMGAL